MPSARTIWATVRHIPAEQLLRRVELIVKRKARVRLEARFPGVLRSPARARPRPLSQWPTPLFKPRDHLVDDGDALFLRRRVPMMPDWSADWPDLDAVTLHYHEYLESMADDVVQDVIADWIREVPPYGARYWVGGWNAYALSLRVLVWMQQLAVRQARLDPAFVQHTERSIADQLGFLSRNVETDIRGNHLIKNIKTLAWGARCFDGADVERWSDQAERLLDDELDKQVLPDGMHFERSPAYHLQVFADLLETYGVLQEGALRNRLGVHLDRMARAAALTTHPDGCPSHFNDGGLHMAYTARECLQVWRTQRSEHEHPHTEGAHALPDAGYYTWRQGEDLLVVDCGPLCPDELPGHAHGDALAVEWSVAGQRILVDRGVLEYRPGEARQRSKGTAQHNTLTLDDADQAEFYGSFRVGRRPQVRALTWMPRPDGLLLQGQHDGFQHLAGRPVHVRTIDIRNRSLRLKDRVVGGRSQLAVSRLLLHPDVRVERDGLRLRVGALIVDVEHDGVLRVEPSEWWPDFGHTITTQQLVFTWGQAPCEGRVTLSASTT